MGVAPDVRLLTQHHVNIRSGQAPLEHMIDIDAFMDGDAPACKRQEVLDDGGGVLSGFLNDGQWPSQGTVLG